MSRNPETLLMAKQEREPNRSRLAIRQDVAQSVETLMGAYTEPKSKEIAAEELHDVAFRLLQGAVGRHDAGARAGARLGRSIPLTPDPGASTLRDTVFRKGAE